MASVNLDTASRLNIECRKGDTFNLPLNFGTAMNTSGWALQVRATDTSEGESNITLEAGDGEVTVSDNSDAVTNALVTIVIPAATMATVASGLYVYDLQNTSSGVVKTYTYGTFKINEDITV